MSTDPFNATIIERIDLNPHLAIVKVKPDSGEASPFIPGQFCTLGLPRADGDPERTAQGKPPRLIRRAYSIASSGEVTDHREFFVVLVEEGKLTPKLFEVAEGGRVWMSDRCDGHFTLDAVKPGRNLAMLATGTGIAPYISILRTNQLRLARGESQPWARSAVLHGCRVESDLGYQEELSALDAADPSFTYVPTLTRVGENETWHGRRGRLPALMEPELFESVTGFPLDPENTEVMLCGNPAMIETVEQMLEPMGFVTATKKQEGNIHFERYW